MESSTKNVDIDVRLLEVELNSILKGWRIDTLQNPHFAYFFALLITWLCDIILIMSEYIFFCSLLTESETVISINMYL